jgi:hypothetical protein
MARSNREIELPRWQRLRDSISQATSMSMPLAVHHRLERLARAAADVNASRAEIIAMLICEAPLDDPEELERRILAYRRMTVGDVISSDGQDDSSDTVIVPIARPGRPRKRTGI